MKQEDTKNLILEKALDLFSRYGYEAVSVGEIAKEVGIKAPSLYNHYPSKQSIFDAIFEKTAKRYAVATDKIDIHMQDVKEDVHLFEKIDVEDLIQKVKEMFLYSLHDPWVQKFRKMMTVEQFRSSAFARLYSSRYVESMVNYHAAIFKNLMMRKEIMDVDDETLSLLYVSPIITLMGVCDREPEKEEECLRKLEAHVRLFYLAFHKKEEEK